VPNVFKDVNKVHAKTLCLLMKDYIIIFTCTSGVFPCDIIRTCENLSTPFDELFTFQEKKKPMKDKRKDHGAGNEP